MSDNTLFIAFIAPVIGIASALLTILLTLTLQHYFWQRQRHTERQLAVIEEIRTLGAEVQFLVFYQPEEISSRRERIHIALFKMATSVDTLFSEAAFDQFCHALRSMEDVLKEPGLHEQRVQVYNQLGAALVDALFALYHDMGIPPTPPRQWLREHAWQPIRGLVWDCPQRAWHERGWPTLHRWGGLARTWEWDYPQQYWRMNGQPMLQRWGAQLRTRIRRP